ncbi:MAG: hypothetical protein JSS90_07505 [Bacteroidetes bacterium]|nr:hypothetical protein [Bacteroidota bacterium]
MENKLKYCTFHLRNPMSLRTGLLTRQRRAGPSSSFEMCCYFFTLIFQRAGTHCREFGFGYYRYPIQQGVIWEGTFLFKFISG